jgi:hypothetical protein
MKRKALIAGAAVLAAGVLLAVGIFIGRDLRPGQAPATTQSDQEITEAMPAPTTTTEPKPDDVTIGATQDYKAEGYHIRFTVFRYRELGASPYRPSRRSTAVEVKATVLAAPPPDEFGFGGAPQLTWMAWTLQDAAGHTYEAEATGDESFELYPEDKATPVGTSRRGWIPFQLPAKVKVTTIEYTPENANRSLKWPIK